MWRVQTDEPCGGVISGWDGRTLRRVSGRTRDGWRGGKAGEWGIGSVIRCSTVRAVRAREKRLMRVCGGRARQTKKLTLFSHT